MNETWERSLKSSLKTELETVPFSEEEQNRLLAGIHKQLEGRSRSMRLIHKKGMIVLAAALLTVGTVTAIAAGKITGLVSFINKDEAITSVEELKQQAKGTLGDISVPEVLAGENTFKEGYLREVGAVDEQGNTIDSYPDVTIMYHGDKKISLSISKPLSGIPQEPAGTQKQEEYAGIMINGKEDNYLFLPPDAQPSEEDQKMEQEGRLYISYGSSEEERQVFKSVTWTMDGLSYHLFTFEEVELDAIMGAAKEVIDAR